MKGERFCWAKKSYVKCYGMLETCEYPHLFKDRHNEG